MQKKVALVKGRVVFYEPTNLKAAKSQLTFHLLRHRPKEPLKGPLSLTVLWLFPKGKNHKDGTWRITRPDTDNLEKMLKDCMIRCGFWKDDAQVVKEYVENGTLNHREIGAAVGVKEEVHDKITALVVYTESLNGLMFNEFKYVWTGGKHLHHFRCYALHGGEGLFKTIGMNPDPNLDDVKVLIGRVGDVPDGIHVGIRDIVEENMLVQDDI